MDSDQAEGTICPSDVAGREILNIESLFGKQRQSTTLYLPLATGLTDQDSPTE